MPQSLEKQSLQARRHRKQQKNRQRFLTAGLIFLATLIAIGGGHLIHQVSAPLKLGPLSISPITLAGLWGILILLLTFLAWQLSVRRTLWLAKYKGRFKPQHVLVFFLLGLALVLSENPQLFSTPFHNGVTQIIHRPQPPTNSPWPWTATVQPSILNIPPEVETSIESISAYIVRQEAEPTLRLKAAHDYVLKRLTYDKKVLTTGQRPSQEAADVFKSRKAVCEGYAKLFQALGRAMGEKVLYVSGNVRRDLAPLDVIPTPLRLKNLDYDWTDHAWNVIKVAGNWQLVDTTWDDSENGNYQTDYLMPPPQVMITSHFPDLASWQLLRQPTNAREFEDGPMLSPVFFAEQLQLLSPTQYQTDTQKIGLIEIQHPLKYDNFLHAGFTKVKENKFSFWDLLQVNPTSESQPGLIPCKSQIQNLKTAISCQFPAKGTYQVVLWSEGQQRNPLGQLKFQSQT